MSRYRPTHLPTAESARLRAAYIQNFIDSTSEHYEQYIATRKQFSDGQRYAGYLWECLRKPERITRENLINELRARDEVLMMADDHSRDKVICAPLWPYQPNSIVSIKTGVVLHLFPALPEDLYFFDETVSWTLIMTHESDDEGEICARVVLK